MAIKQGSECYTKWTHVENGRVLVRRIHRIEVQARNGRLYTVKGDALPDCIVTYAGVGFKGEHLAQILLSTDPPTRRTAYTPPELQAWPTFRDVVNLGLGFLSIMLLKFFASVIGGL